MKYENLPDIGNREVNAQATSRKRCPENLGRKPQEIYQLNPRQFEILVAELYEERGYKVQITQQTGDGGKDLIILDDRELGNFMIYAECKKYAPNRPVGANVVSDLVGRIAADRDGRYCCD